MTKPLLAGAVAARALAAPAAAIAFPPVPEGQALYPETVPGAGLSGVAGARYTIVRSASGRGTAGGALFSLTKRSVTYGNFRSVAVHSLLFGRNAVKLRGIGLVDGKRVRFTAIGVHNARPGVDVFRIAWNHGASLGGTVTSGLLFIR